nr:family 1 glycosylhydrolase [Spirochaetota bacterium]
VNFGIKPIVSLQNNSIPVWFENIGSFLSDKSIIFFERYTEYVVRNLGETISNWITFNDANLRLLNKYLKDKSKPSVKNRDFFIELNNIILSHIKSYGKIYEISLNYNKKDVKVGFSLNLPFFNSKNSLIDKMSLEKANKYFYEAFLIGMGEGRLIKKNLRDFRNGKTLFFDFLGINYYNLYKVNFSFTELVKAEPVSENLRENFEGIDELFDKKFKKIPRPIIFIENRGGDSLNGCLNARVITPDLND